VKVAVTAVSGQLGSAIAQQLISKIGNENVVGTARTTSKAEHLGIILLPGDYNSKSDFKTAAGRSQITWEDFFNTLKQS